MNDERFRDPSRPSSAGPAPSSGGSAANASGGPVAPVGNRGVATQRRRRARTFLLTLLLVLIVGIALWTWIAVSFAYANGEKRGYVQKLVRTGWLCKTWEGELAVTPIPGTSVAPSVFAFTVRDDSVASALQRASGQLVALQYGQHRGIPSSCFGETEVFVTSFRVVP